MKRNERIPLCGGLEYDALTGWRHVLYWHPGQLKRVKRKYRKRVRRLTRQMLTTLPRSDA
jgi:hypothetical protein